MAKEVLGTQLQPVDQQEVLDSYLYRMTIESVQRWPIIAQCMYRRAFRMPLITDQQWLACTLFKVKANGRLDQRMRSCHTDRPDLSQIGMAGH